MLNIGTIRHTAEDRLQAGIKKHFLCEDDKGVMHIVLWYGSSNAVQVRRSQAKWSLSPNHRDCMLRGVLGSWASKRDTGPATVDNLKEQALSSQFNGFSLRRGLISFDSTPGALGDDDSFMDSLIVSRADASRMAPCYVTHQ
jgi:hypothetical protein